MQDTFAELRQTQSFQGMLESIGHVQEKKAKLTRTILMEEQGRKAAKQLRHQLKELAETREQNLLEQSELIAQLKDQLQVQPYHAVVVLLLRLHAGDQSAHGTGGQVRQKGGTGGGGHDTEEGPAADQGDAHTHIVHELLTTRPGP